MNKPQLERHFGKQWHEIEQALVFERNKRMLFAGIKTEFIEGKKIKITCYSAAYAQGSINSRMFAGLQ